MYDISCADKFPTFKVQDVAMDGNCMFSSIAIQLGNTPDSHMEVRSEIVEYMESHPEMVGNI